jgi:hypothetical protein
MKTNIAKQSIVTSTREYEDWLRSKLGAEFREQDLSEKHCKMRYDPFQFLRGTYYRWAETILLVCPDLAHTPTTLAVGDIHLENFGTWRDEDGRVIWGVNDFDEAAEMPYVLDLVRLATSAALARSEDALALEDFCAAILDGYGRGLREPRPFVLDEKHRWLRSRFVATKKSRAAFWEKIDALKDDRKGPSERWRTALRRAMPDPAIALTFRRRVAGTGSLGRPRWIAIGTWRGGRIVREAKPLVSSWWTLVPGRGSPRLRVAEITAGVHRAPDPWYRITGNIAVRRLSPNSQKIEVDAAARLCNAKMLHLMGRELANIHLGTGHRGAAIKKDFDGRKKCWLLDATEAATDFVSNEFGEWKRMTNSARRNGRAS